MPQSVETCNTKLSNPAKILAAYMRCSGITDAKQLAADLDIPVRTIQRLKMECAISGASDAVSTHATCAMGGAPVAPNAPYMAPSETPDAPDMAFSDPQPSCAGANKESPSEIVISQEIKQTNSREEVGSSALKVAFNGSTENMIVDVLAWMGPTAERSNAQKWLTSMLSLHGREVVLATYQQLIASQAQGGIIASPISYFSKVATAIKAGGSGDAAKPVNGVKTDPGLARRVWAKMQAEGRVQ